jgi:hypothetical protein
MSALGQARQRRGGRFFTPGEVATVIDMFSPSATIAAANRKRRRPASLVDWARLLVLGTMGVVLCAGAASLSRSPASPAPAARSPVAITTAARQVVVVEPAIPARVERSRPTVHIVARARRPLAVVDTLAALNRQAMVAYQRRQLAGALGILSRGAHLCERPALAWNDLCALTHVNLGVVLAGGYKQPGLAAKHFRIARAIDPTIAPSPRVAGPEIVAAFRHASLPGGRL